MKKEVILSGFGGQGVMSIGKNLVEAAVEEDLEASWVPSYGPEMRGGTANCSVVLSSRPVGSPVFTHPTELIAMNAPSIDKFGALVVPGGLVMINSSVVKERFERPDVQTLYIPCETLASELGSPKAANMVMLGFLSEALGLIGHQDLLDVVKDNVNPRFVELNFKAAEAGAAYAKEHNLYFR